MSRAKPSWAALCSSWRGPPFLQGRNKAQSQGPCPAHGTAFPSLPQLPSRLTHTFPCALALPLPPKAPSCSLPPPFQLHPPGQTGRRGRSWQPPESPAPHHRAEHVSLPYMKEGSPRADAPWAAQTPAAQQGAACMPEEAAALARPCLAFIGNEDKGFGSGLCGSP